MAGLKMSDVSMRSIGFLMCRAVTNVMRCIAVHELVLAVPCDRARAHARSVCMRGDKGFACMFF